MVLSKKSPMCKSIYTIPQTKKLMKYKIKVPNTHITSVIPTFDMISIREYQITSWDISPLMTIPCYSNWQLFTSTNKKVLQCALEHWTLSLHVFSCDGELTNTNVLPALTVPFTHWNISRNGHQQKKHLTWLITSKHQHKLKISCWTCLSTL